MFVQNGNVPATGLTRSDFVLTDNGAVQVIDSVAPDRRPVDLTMLLDVNESVPPTLAQVTQTIASLARLLTPDDRIRVITFGADVTLTLPLQPAARPLSIGLVARSGASSQNAAILYALMQPGQPDRRHLIVASTAGHDTEQLLGPDQLSAVANRSDALLVVLLTKRDFTSLGEIVRATGGAIYGLNGDLPSAVNGVLDNFKGSYRVRWTPQQVKGEGWHELKVTVPNFKKYTVRTRKGYLGSP